MLNVKWHAFYRVTLAAGVIERPVDGILHVDKMTTYKGLPLKNADIINPFLRIIFNICLETMVNDTEYQFSLFGQFCL